MKYDETEQQTNPGSDKIESSLNSTGQKTEANMGVTRMDDPENKSLLFTAADLT
jgi:hypothetical protein